MIVAYFAGLRLGLGLIVAIGPQNAFVLRQGLLRRHVFAVAAFCAVSDAILIGLGVGGFAIAADRLPGLAEAFRWAGAAFLFWYGARAFRSAVRGGESLHAAQGQGAGLPGTLATVAALTWANPHVWLDTVVLLGGISAQFPGREMPFGLGAATGSFLFFFALAYGARLLAPIFARPRAWQVLEAVIGVVMWSIALRLVLG